MSRSSSAIFFSVGLSDCGSRISTGHVEVGGQAGAGEADLADFIDPPPQHAREPADGELRVLLAVAAEHADRRPLAALQLRRQVRVDHEDRVHLPRRRASSSSAAASSVTTSMPPSGSAAR